jgi:hypothetical protein
LFWFKKKSVMREVTAHGTLELGLNWITLQLGITQFPPFPVVCNFSECVFSSMSDRLSHMSCPGRVCGLTPTHGSLFPGTTRTHKKPTTNQQKTYVKVSSGLSHNK